MTTYAGRYDEVLLATRGTSTSLYALNKDTVQVEVFESDGATNATLYDDRDKTAYSGTGSIVLPDDAGNLEFFADPGTYVLVVSDGDTTLRTDTVVVSVDPDEASGGVVPSGASAGDLLAINGAGDGYGVVDPGTYSRSYARDAQVTDGATGDGTTDDLTALDAFVAGLTVGGDPGLVPPGTYSINGPWVINKAVEVHFAPGAKLLSTYNPGTDAALVQVTAGATIRDLHVDGDDGDHQGISVAADGVTLAGHTVIENVGRIGLVGTSADDLQADRITLNRTMVTTDGAAANFEGALRLNGCERARIGTVEIEAAYGKAVTFSSSVDCVIGTVVVVSTLAQGLGLYANGAIRCGVDNLIVVDPFGGALKFSRGSVDCWVGKGSVLRIGGGDGSAALLQGASRSRIEGTVVPITGAGTYSAYIVRAQAHPITGDPGDGNVIALNFTNPDAIAGLTAIRIDSTANDTDVSGSTFDGFDVDIDDEGARTIRTFVSSRELPFDAPDGYSIIAPGDRYDTHLTVDADRLYAVWMPTRRHHTIDQVRVRAQAAGAAGTVLRIGLYADVDGLPGPLIAELGTLDGASTSSTQQLSGFTHAVDGPVWFAVVAQGGTPTMYARRNPPYTPPASGGEGTMIGVQQYPYPIADGVTGSLPATWPGGDNMFSDRARYAPAGVVRVQA